MNEHLMRALLYSGLFFATCTDEQCELDTAVKQLEGLTAELDRLSAADKAEFRAFMLREAAAHHVAMWPRRSRSSPRQRSLKKTKSTSSAFVKRHFSNAAPATALVPHRVVSRVP